MKACFKNKNFKIIKNLPSIGSLCKVLDSGQIYTSYKEALLGVNIHNLCFKKNRVYCDTIVFNDEDVIIMDYIQIYNGEIVAKIVKDNKEDALINIRGLYKINSPNKKYFKAVFKSLKE